MPLRIAFDVDGVLADMDAAVEREAARLFADSQVALDASSTEKAGDSEVPPGDPPWRTIGLTMRQRRQLWKAVRDRENFWEALAEIEPGIIARLAALAAARRWDVIFLTRRPATEGDTPQVQTQRWLQQHGFPIPSVFVVAGSRGRIAAALALDFVVDDQIENCLDITAHSPAQAILVRRARHTASDLSQASRPDGVGVVGSVAECLDMLVRADEHQDRPGMMERVRRLLRIRA